MDKICPSGSDSFQSYFGFKKTSLLKEVGILELFFAIFTLNWFPAYLKHALKGAGKVPNEKKYSQHTVKTGKEQKKCLESTF